MNWFILARTLFVAAVAFTAGLLQPLSSAGVGTFGAAAGLALNVAVGVALALLVIVFEHWLKDVSATTALGALIGGTIGLVIARTIETALTWTDTRDPRVAFLRSAVLLVLPYIGTVIGARKGEWLEPARLVALFRAAGPQRRYKVLDTSVIIDGRIADICETGFIDGALVIPQFVLKELQMVADSADALKRNRGRRGLDILQKIQKMSGVEVVISDVDFPEVREVDLKLIELARSLQGKIVTNDFNLNKVAQLRGVDVLNINQLANSLKPVVLPGEIMKVFILKEGKEYNQGVAYLDDGTMVVVDNARRMISKTIDVVVTSVLQTTAGKMIFGRHIEPGSARAVPGAVHARPRAGARPPPRPAAPRPPSRSRTASCSRHPRARGTRTTRTGGRGETPAVPLVADGLLPDPGDCRLHRRARDAVDRLEFRPAERILRAQVRARLVVAHPQDDRRRRRGARPRSPHAGHDLHLHLQPPEHLRHPDHLLERAVAVADHRQGLARTVPVSRMASQPDRAPARRPEEARPARDSEAVEGPRVEGAVADRVSRRARGVRTGPSAGSRAGVFCWQSRRDCPSFRFRSPGAAT